MTLPDRIFRAYDIRGIVPDDLNEDIVRRIGCGYAYLMKQDGRTRIAIGHDVRETSPGFAEALTEGVRSVGVDVVQLGQCTTPMLYYSAVALEVGGGIMVTGSHNPIEYNGLKLCRGVWPIWGDEIQRLKHVAEAAEPVGEPGSIEEIDIFPAYRQELVSKFKLARPFSVAIDCGNGTAGPVVVPILEDLGCQVHGLYVEPDGTFPNHLPDPEVPKYMKALQDLVADKKPDIAFGFDGDSDRVGLIDETGRKLSADHILLVMARYLLEKHPGGKIIFDVKCSDFLMKDLAQRGGRPMIWKTGHSIIKEKLRAEDALLAGELSGHICVAEGYYGFDDAIYAALLLLQILSDSGGRCSDLFADIPETFYTPEVKLPVAEEAKFETVTEIVKYFKRNVGPDRVLDIDGARVTFDDGWALIRASNTTANLTARVEGKTADALSRITNQLLDSLKDQPVDSGPLKEFAG